MLIKVNSLIFSHKEMKKSNRTPGDLISIPDLHYRDKSSRLDAQHRLKLVERGGRLRSNVALSRMEFEDAKRRLEGDEESLKTAQEALRQWDADKTDAIIMSTERMSIDPDVLRPSYKGKGKAKATFADL